MSVRRTVAQSSAGLLLLAAFAAGPSVAFGDAPASPGVPGQSDGGCAEDAPATAFADTSTYEADGTVTITGTCFPGHKNVSANLVLEGADVEASTTGMADGSGTVYLTFEPSSGGTYTAALTSDEGTQANVTFTVEGAGSEPGGDGDEEEDPPPTTDPGPGPGPGEGDDSEEPGEGDEDQGNEDPDSGDDGQEQDGEDSGSGEDDPEQGGDDHNSVDDGSVGDSDGDQAQETENGDESGNVEGSDEEQQGDDTTAPGSPTQPIPGDEQDGDTSASAANDGAASKGKAPAQPPAAPGSATNDFPAAQQEATADQKQSAALAVLMTQLFAGGVSTGSVGTTPDQARTVIDPSADASEIEVPAGSDTGGSSDDGSGSESSDGDALAATGSNMLVPAGIAAAAILLGAGLKIHQLRRGL